MALGRWGVAPGGVNAVKVDVSTLVAPTPHRQHRHSGVGVGGVNLVYPAVNLVYPAGNAPTPPTGSPAGGIVPVGGNAPAAGHSGGFSAESRNPGKLRKFGGDFPKIVGARIAITGVISGRAIL